MMRVSRSRITVGLALALTLWLAGTGVSTSAQAQDFFSALFGGGAPAPRPFALPFGSPFDEARPAPAPRPSSGGGGGRTAYCVRTCDGRYFPAPATEGQSRASVCNSFCPASETKVFYGGSIDNASTESGKSYSDLPNAFRYRNELVAGCTCNGKDSVGLAAIKIDDDRTLRKGDIVAGPSGLVVASGRPDKRTAVNFTPVSPSVRAKFERVPVVANE
ncbi:DUF2865 domain-containing protein [Bradyrhizobium prioriisuperbiae]|uniref:DUF2865 domain-containing protein n=1 Tax=Bradyrhizobium prioriisuperbiae TaxID=2854389 RepID=UPI0038991BFF